MQAATTTTTTTSSLPWVEKYRPARLEDAVPCNTLQKWLPRLAELADMPHLLLFGPPGTGKTTFAQALALRIYDHQPSRCQQLCLSLNASDERGLEVVREQIRDFVASGAIDPAGRDGSHRRRAFKLVILDEADALTLPAQKALRNMMETYVAVARFVLLANEKHHLLPAIQSRCLVLRFAPLPALVLEQIIDRVVKQEHLPRNDDADNDGDNKVASSSNGRRWSAARRLQLAQACDGDARRAVQALEGIELAFRAHAAVVAAPFQQQQQQQPLAFDLTFWIQHFAGVPHGSLFAALSHTVMKSADAQSLSGLREAVHAVQAFRQAHGMSVASLLSAWYDAWADASETTRQQHWPAAFSHPVFLCHMWPAWSGIVVNACRTDFDMIQQTAAVAECFAGRKLLYCVVT